MERRRGQLQFHTFSGRFVYRLHLTIQGMKTWPKVSKYRRRSKKLYSINCGQIGHFIKLTYVRLSIYSTHCHVGAFSSSIKFSVDQIFFLHRLNCSKFWVYKRYTWYLKFERHGSLVVALSDFAWRHQAVVAGENAPRNFSDDVLDFAFNQ